MFYCSFNSAPILTEPYFLPPFGVNHELPLFGVNHEVDPPLRPNGSLTIGYSNGSDKVHPGGSGPFVYVCRPGKDMDVGFLKLFLSDKYIDLSTLLQGVTTALGEGRIRGTKVAPKPTDGIWTSMVVTVVQEMTRKSWTTSQNGIFSFLPSSRSHCIFTFVIV